MSDVFISYARGNEVQAARIEQCLLECGHDVWRDAELPPHRPYAEVIEERLKSAKAVVVLWSADAVKSQWVRAEADAARELGTLVQASVDGTKPPIPFNQIQCADLSEWRGEAGHTGWDKLRSSVTVLVGGRCEHRPPNKVRQKKRSICVLPFVNMSGDPEQEYFSDGISEDITTDLSKVSALEVIARNTAASFKDHPGDVTSIASKLGVSHVLEGSVRKAANRVRITAQLIDGSTGGAVWADRYDRELTDIFAIQDEISNAIVEALKVRLLPEEKKSIESRGTTSADAYNLYLLARQYWVTGNHGDVRREERTERICKRALELDSDYANAWALMALAQATLRFNYGRQGDGGLAAAQRALQINTEIAEAHCVLARNYSEEGRHRDAENAIKRALELNPASWEVNKEAARMYEYRQQYAEAAKHYEIAVEVLESDVHAWANLLMCYHSTGDTSGIARAAPRTVREAERLLASDAGNGAALSFGVNGLAALGEADRAKEWIERGLLVDPDNFYMLYNFAWALAAFLGDKEGALRLLERVFINVRGPAIRLAETDPGLDSLRDDPRFQKMLADCKARIGVETRQACPPLVS